MGYHHISLSENNTPKSSGRSGGTGQVLMTLFGVKMRYMNLEDLGRRRETSCRQMKAATTFWISLNQKLISKSFVIRSCFS